MNQSNDAAKTMTPGSARLNAGAIGTFLSLALCSGIVFVFRWVVLASSQYPPSGDAGGELYWSHFWLGKGPIGFFGQPQFPPLEPLAVVYPFTHVFPLFVGIKLYMAIVPALIVFPAYFFLRESSLDRLLCVSGGLLTASLAIYSQMADWNAGANLLGIFFLLFALGFLIRALRTGTLFNCALTGLFVGLIGATHELTLTVTVLTFAFTFVFYLAFSIDSMRDRLRRVLLVTGYSAIFLIPMIPLYRYLLTQQANIGVGDYSTQLQAAYFNFVFFAWSGEGVHWSTVIAASVILTILGVVTVALTPTHHKDRPFLMVLASVSAASLVMPPIEAASAQRGLYFLPIAFVPLTLYFFQGLSNLCREFANRPVVGNAARRSWRKRSRRVAPLVPLALVVLFLAGTIQYSCVSMQKGDSFYARLSPDAVAAMDWLNLRTPSNAVVFDSADLAPWVLGYAQRAADSPARLSNEATQRSYELTNESNLVEEGNYLTGDAYVTVGNDFPDAHGSPTVFFYSPGQWVDLLEAQGGFVYDRVGSGFSVYNLVQARLLDGPTCASSTISISCAYSLGWPHSSFTMTELVNVSAQAATIVWSTPIHSTLSVNITWRAPPSGYVARYSQLGNPNLTSVQDQMATLSGIPFSFTASTMSIRQSVDNRTGWITLQTNGSTLGLEFSGLRSSKDAPFFLDTSTVLTTLGVDYFIVDQTTHYTMFTRLEAGTYGPFPVVPSYDCGAIWIFVLDPINPVTMEYC